MCDTLYTNVILNYKKDDFYKREYNVTDLIKIVFGNTEEINKIVNDFHVYNWNELTKGFFNYLNNNHRIELTQFGWDVINNQTNKLIKDDEISYFGLDKNVISLLFDKWKYDKVINITEKNIKC